MAGVPLGGDRTEVEVQGYFAHKKPPPPPGPPYEPRHGPTVGSYWVACSHERGTPVWQVFLSEGIDVALIEVGLGGRLDATNVTPQPL